MREERPVPPVKLFCGMLAADVGLFAGAEDALQERFGEIDMASRVMPFDFTDHYRKEMGPGLLRKFVSFSALVDPGLLAGIKTETNAMERRFAAGPDGRGARRVNLDPGYVAPAKLVLATTKGSGHRIYLGHGIHAEVTLNFTKSGCRTFEWTYPDYASGAYDEFFLALRRGLMVRRDPALLVKTR